jgi:hypothetical protein
MSTPPPITQVVSNIASEVATGVSNVASGVATGVSNVASGVATGVSNVGTGANNLISDSSKGIGNVLSTSGQIVGQIGTNLGKTVEEVSNIPKNICTYNSVINIIIIVIFAYYLYKKMSVMTSDQNSLLIEGIMTGVVISVFLWISMTTMMKQ